MSIAPDARLMMLPDRCSTMNRPAAWHPNTTPMKLTACTRWKSASLVSSRTPSVMIPALFTMTSMRPCAETVLATSASTSPFCETSTSRPVARPPESVIAATVSWALSVFRSAHTTIAPASASREADARPMPRPAPVTTATRPDRSNVSAMVAIGGGAYSPTQRVRSGEWLVHWTDSGS